jgi:hypothetical protein
MKTYNIFLLIFTSLALQAQNFELVGNRNINEEFNWDVPFVSENYIDDNGFIYIYINEASQPRSNELIRYDEVNNTWLNLTNNSFIVPGVASTTHGVGQSDGSIFTVTSSFDGNHYAFQLFPDGTFTGLGNPANTNNENAKIATAINPLNDELYYLHAGLDRVRVQRYDGKQWLELPDIEQVSSGGTEGIDLAFDELGNLYATYHGNNNLSARVAMFDGTQWTNIFTSPGEGFEPSFHVVSSSEIYLSLSGPGINIQVYKYDGTAFTAIGNTIPATYSGSNILKASNGDLFLATGEENGFYRFDDNGNDWEAISNDISDGLAVSGFRPELLEANGFIYSTFTDVVGITTVRFTESILSITTVEENNQSFVLYPNPASENISIQFREDVQIQMINVYSALGELITTTKDSSISVSNLSEGMYFVEVITDKGISCKRFVKN